jgi:hypothetical protein
MTVSHELLQRITKMTRALGPTVIALVAMPSTRWPMQARSQDLVPDAVTVFEIVYQRRLTPAVG